MSGQISFPRVVLDRAHTLVRLEINRDEDWDDPFVLQEGERPIDLTGCRLELYVRVTYDGQLIKKLSSAPGGGIHIDQPASGTAYVFLPQAIVANTFLAGAYKHFLLLLQDSVNPQAMAREVWRGDFIVHGGTRT